MAGCVLSHIHLFVGFVMLISLPSVAFADDPTSGCKERNYTYKIQKPYDVPLESRYNYSNGVHTLWVYSDDKPFNHGTTSFPRTELRFEGHDYSSGVWQFEADLNIPTGTNATSLVQIHPTVNKLPVTQLRVYRGMLTHLISEILEENIYDKWIHVNVVHDVGGGSLYYYVNGRLQLTSWNLGGYVGPAFYFKCGVYTQDYASHLMVARFKNIKIWEC